MALHELETESDSLRLELIAKRFGGLDALRGISFNISRGSITGIIGPNGAGKTTLFNIITGVVRPTSGRMSFAGKDITGLRPDELARLGISRTFQNVRLFRRMNVLENVLVGSVGSRGTGWRDVFRLHRNHGATSQSTEEARALLSRVGLEGTGPLMAGSLPYGRQRRVEIARALASKPRIILLDEPSAGMNPEEADDLARVVAGLRDDGLTVVVIEHNMHLVMGLCDKVVVLNFGAKIAEGTASHVAADPDVISAYLGTA